MQTLDSFYFPLAAVQLPWRGRQLHMHPINTHLPELPGEFADYLEIVRGLCRAGGYFCGQAWVTVDEKVVAAGCTQRRPRPHVDGHWTGYGFKGDPRPGFKHSGRFPRMPIIVAASVPGCRAWRGRFRGDPRADGDLAHIAEQLGEGEILPANTGYLLTADCVHESLVMPRTARRTFLRITLAN